MGKDKSQQILEEIETKMRVGKLDSTLLFLASSLSFFLWFAANPFWWRRRYLLPYEVELVNPETKTFKTDWSLIKQYPTIEDTEKAAENYWAPKNVKQELKEVLVESDIRITKCLI